MRELTNKEQKELEFWFLCYTIRAKGEKAKKMWPEYKTSKEKEDE